MTAIHTLLLLLSPAATAEPPPPLTIAAPGGPTVTVRLLGKRRHFVLSADLDNDGKPELTYAPGRLQSDNCLLETEGGQGPPRSPNAMPWFTYLHLYPSEAAEPGRWPADTSEASKPSVRLSWTNPNTLRISLDPDRNGKVDVEQDIDIR